MASLIKVQNIPAQNIARTRTPPAVLTRLHQLQLRILTTKKRKTRMKKMINRMTIQITRVPAATTLNEALHHHHHLLLIALNQSAHPPLSLHPIAAWTPPPILTLNNPLQLVSPTESVMKFIHLPSKTLTTISPPISPLPSNLPLGLSPPRLSPLSPFQPLPLSMASSMLLPCTLR